MKADPNIVSRLDWIFERFQDGDVGEAAKALGDLLDELRNVS
jgi:hypothetical protein